MWTGAAMEIDLSILRKAAAFLGWKPAWWPPYLRQVGLPGALLFLLTALLASVALTGPAAGAETAPAATPLDFTGQETSTPVAPSPTPTPRPTATPTPVPVVYVVQDDSVVYLLSKPGLDIITSVPVGEQVTMRDDVQPRLAGSITWVAVTYEGTDGWLADYQVYPIRAGYSLLAEGRYLYDAPGGQPAEWIYRGTAYHVQRTGGDWLEISLADGRTGWIPAPQEKQP